MSLQLEKKVVKYVLSTKTVSINIADFENVVDGIKDEEIKSQIFKVGLVLMFPGPPDLRSPADRYQ